MDNYLKNEIFLYLEDLREWSKINMFQAVPFIMADFDISKIEAKNILILWMKSYNKK